MTGAEAEGKTATMPANAPGNPYAYKKEHSALKNLKNLLVQSFNEWSDDKAPTFAASLAYYTVFSLAPTLIIVLAIAGAVFGDDAARGAVAGQLSDIIGASAAKTVQEAMVAAGKRESGLFATIVGIVVTVFAATGVFAELQNALNTIWKVKPKPINTILAFLKTRFLSLAVVMGIGFLLLVSLVVSAVLSAFGSWVGNQMPGWTLLTQIINVVVSLGVITLLFGLMFKLLPDTKIAWRDVWLGAGLTSALFAVGKFAISLYLTKSAVESSYGAAGSLAALLVWVYYSSMTMLFGAEVAQVYARTRGSLISTPQHEQAPHLGPQQVLSPTVGEGPVKPLAQRPEPVLPEKVPDALLGGYSMFAGKKPS